MNDSLGLWLLELTQVFLKLALLLCDELHDLVFYSFHLFFSRNDFFVPISDLLLEIFGQSRLVDDKAFKEHCVTLAKKSVRLSISDAIFLDYALEAFIQFFCLLNDAL